MNSDSVNLGSNPSSPATQNTDVSAEGGRGQIGHPGQTAHNGRTETGTGQATTPMSDHVARFWHILETETVRICVDQRQERGAEAPDGPVVYWDASTFSDETAKALVVERGALLGALKALINAIGNNPILSVDEAERIALGVIAKTTEAQ